MTDNKTNIVHLSRAYMCTNCECIGDSASRCPACGGDALLSLARLLEGPSRRGEVTKLEVTHR